MSRSIAVVFPYWMQQHGQLGEEHAFRTFEHVVREGKVTLVPDRHNDGTNVLAFPAHSAFTTAYGPGSFDNHKRIAAQAGLDCEVINDNMLELDLDTADDLTELARRESENDERE